MYLICHMTSHDHLIERACEFMGGSSLCYVTTLMTCDHKHCDGGDIKFLICRLTSREHMFKGLCEFVSGSPSR